MTKTLIHSMQASYQAPACEILTLGSEGVLCASVFGNNTEDGSYSEGIFD